MTQEILQEREKCLSPDFQLGEHIYMGMGLVNDHRVCLSVAYKIDYCYKKAQQFVAQAPDTVAFTHINKVKVGETQACRRFELNDK